MSKGMIFRMKKQLYYPFLPYLCQDTFAMAIYDTHTTACFTGHRTYRNTHDEELREAIRALYAEGYRTFLSGMAMGFDLAAARVVLELQETLAGLRLVAVVPFDGAERRFDHESRMLYNKIIGSAAEVVILADNYHPGAYAQRNNFLVDNSSALVAYFTGEKGGTAYTVRRATKRGLHCRNLYVSSQLIMGF